MRAVRKRAAFHDEGYFSETKHTKLACSFWRVNSGFKGFKVVLDHLICSYFTEPSPTGRLLDYMRKLIMGLDGFRSYVECNFLDAIFKRGVL